MNQGLRSRGIAVALYVAIQLALLVAIGIGVAQVQLHLRVIECALWGVMVAGVTCGSKAAWFALVIATLWLPIAFGVVRGGLSVTLGALLVLALIAAQLSLLVRLRPTGLAP